MAHLLRFGPLKLPSTSNQMRGKSHRAVWGWRHYTRTAVLGNRFRNLKFQPSLDDYPAPRHFHGIWCLPDPSKIDHRIIVNDLPVVMQSRENPSPVATKAIFLATPLVARWFSPDHGFLSDAIHRMYGECRACHELECYIAIVDALPSPIVASGLQGSRPSMGAEGIALCLTDSKVDVSNGSAHEDAGATIRFVIPCVTSKEWSNQRRRSLSITLPVANTTFITGSRTTLTQYIWRATKTENELSWTLSRPARRLGSLSLPLPTQNPDHVGMHLPLTALTPRRRIVSSMGNVLREVMGDDSQVIKASAELEKAVPTFIKHREAQGAGSIQVYALVGPEWSVLENEKTRRMIVPKMLSSHQKIYKVTGGGGGWGKKAGLLSLDTATDFNDPDDGMFDMFPQILDDVEGVSKQSAEALPVGHTVQFLASWVGPTKAPYDVNDAIQSNSINQWFNNIDVRERGRGNNFVLGTTIPDDVNTSSRPANEDFLHPRIVALRKSFGMLSVKGIGVELNHQLSNRQGLAQNSTSVGSSRIDVPHSYIHVHWGPGKFRNALGHDTTLKDKTKSPKIGPSGPPLASQNHAP